MEETKKGSPASDVLTEGQNIALDAPEYSEEEISYLGGLQIRLERARNQREQPRDEFDGMSYTQYWEANEKGANTFIEPKKNPEDSTYQGGTVRRKIFTFLGELLRFDFFADITAFNEHNIEQRELGNVLEDNISKCREIEGDDEKRLLRWYEMLKQGDVFVEKIWDERFVKEKKFNGAKFDGKIAGVTWVTKLKRKLASTKTRIVCGLNVYLGSINQYDFAEQPYIFTADIIDYSEAQAIYGNWERWKYVSRTLREFSPGDRSLVFNNWRLLDHQKNRVERIQYQDKNNNEFCLILNGVLMTPVGLPLPWGYPDYNIVQQHLKPISATFAYAASIVKELRGNVAILDDLIRIMHLIELKKLMPPRFNLTGRAISRRVFMPTMITPDIDPSKLPLADKEASQGLQGGEFQFVNMLVRNIDDNSLGPIPSGQQPEGDPTAREVMEVSKQAEKILGTIITATSLLEWKLAWIGLYTILAKAFGPIGDRLDEARGEVVKTYQSYAVRKPIGNKGMGYRITYPIDGELPQPEDIEEKENQLHRETGTPYKLLFVNPQIVTAAKWVWQISMRTRPKPTDEISKLMFTKMVNDALALFGDDVNIPNLETEWAVAWDQDPKKFFNSRSQSERDMLAMQERNAVAQNVTMPGQTKKPTTTPQPNAA